MRILLVYPVIRRGSSESFVHRHPLPISDIPVAAQLSVEVRLSSHSAKRHGNKMPYHQYLPAGILGCRGHGCHPVASVSLCSFRADGVPPPQTKMPTIPWHSQENQIGIQ